MTSLKLVIDTNILISAALSAQGAPAKLLQMALAHHRLVFSQATLNELRTRLYRPKFDRYISLENRDAYCMTSTPARFGWMWENLLCIAGTAMMTISSSWL